MGKSENTTLQAIFTDEEKNKDIRYKIEIAHVRLHPNEAISSTLKCLNTMKGKPLDNNRMINYGFIQGSKGCRISSFLEF